MDRQNDPSPREIKQMCKEIRSGWDKATRRKRSVAPKSVHVLFIEKTFDECFFPFNSPIKHEDYDG